MTQVTHLPVSHIIPGHNDRQVFDPAKLKELASSIATHGLAQPITVRPLGPRFQIVAGERRFRAIAQILHWETAPCLIREMSDEEASAIMLAENTSRADLNPIEEARAYQSRIDHFGWDYDKIARTAGVSVDLVKRRLSLLELNEDIQHLIAGGHFPLGHAEAITDLDANRQRIAVRIYRQSKNGLALTPFREIVSQLLAEQSQDALFDLESFWVNQMEALADLPRRGQRAIIGAPTRPDLPNVSMTAKDSTAVIIDRYIAHLLAAGLEDEAATIGTLYTALVRGNYMSVPSHSFLHKT